jgi:hypothetical protein
MLSWLSALAGSQEDEVKQKRNLAKASDFENLLMGLGSQKGLVQQDYESMRAFADAGPNQTDYTKGVGAQRDLADMLKKYSEGGYMPTAQDISSSNQLAQGLFQPRQVGLQQAFSDQTVEANRRAALQGRSMNDPMLAAKLGIEQTRQQAMLGAETNSWAQQYAMSQPGQRLGYATDRTNMLSQLANQAVQNRQAILGLGSQLGSGLREWRLNSADSSTVSGGGLKGAVAGWVSGAKAGMDLTSGAMSMGMGGSKGPTSSGGAGPSMMGGQGSASTPQQYFGLNQNLGGSQFGGMNYTPTQNSYSMPTQSYFRPQPSWGSNFGNGR